MLNYLQSVLKAELIYFQQQLLLFVLHLVHDSPSTVASDCLCQHRKAIFHEQSHSHVKGLDSQLVYSQNVTDIFSSSPWTLSEFSFFDPSDPQCREVLLDPRTTISELFAVLRQWVPQVQKNIYHIGNEVLPSVIIQSMCFNAFMLLQDKPNRFVCTQNSQIKPLSLFMNHCKEK